MFTNTPGFCSQYAFAKRSIMRSIFCASPGRRKRSRNVRMPMSNDRPLKLMPSAYAFSTARLKSFGSPM